MCVYLPVCSGACLGPRCGNTRIYSFSEKLVLFSGCLYWRDLGFSGFTFYGRCSTAVRLVTTFRLHLQDALNARNSQRAAGRNAGLYNSADHSRCTAISTFTGNPRKMAPGIPTRHTDHPSAVPREKRIASNHTDPVSASS